MLRLIDDTVLDEVSAVAATSPRRRRNYNYHRLEDGVQRMLNAIEPDTYIRPHKHEAPDKVEVFLCLRGRAAVLAFDDEGRVLQATAIAPGGPAHGAEVSPRTWHAILSLEAGTVVYEVKDGPYDPATDKHFAPWAPAEGAPEAPDYLERLRRRVKRGT